MKIEELRELIETKTVEVRGFVNENKSEEAKKTMEELRGLKENLKIAEELEESEKRDLENQKNNKEERGNKEMDKVNEIRAIAKVVLGKEMTTEERAVVKTVDNMAVLPKGFIGELEVIKKGYGSLKELCEVIPVKNGNGTRPVADEQQGEELKLVLEGDDIEEDGVATKEIDYKIIKIGKLIKLSSELVDDAEIDIESLVKTIFAEKTVRGENSRILKVINDNAVSLAPDMDYKGFMEEMDSQVPAVKFNLVTLVNSKMYAFLKNMVDKQGRPLNLITNIGGQDYFNGKPLYEFDDSLITLTPDKTKVIYMANVKETVKFFDRQAVTVARAEKFENGNKMLRILERIDVKKGATARSCKKLELA
jgi:HK97 family phage major capsid protein